MNRLKKITELRNKLRKGGHTIGSWMQIPHPSVAEIMGQAGFEWVAVDMEHGAICTHQLPDLFRALELGGTIPLVRLAEGRAKDCKQALDAGAGGVIVPMVESAQHLRSIHEACCWPPVGTRGVGFSRANLFGKFFSEYENEARSPLLVAMIENIRAVDKLPEILAVKGLDAILIGPYDLSASMGVTAKFDDQDFLSAMNKIKKLSDEASMPCGLHIVEPSFKELNLKVREGYRFLAYSIDAVFLYKGVQNRDEGI